MITGTMTGRELHAIFCKDRAALDRFAEEKVKKLARELRKGFGESATQCYDFKIKDVDYKVCVLVNKGTSRKGYFYDVFMYCKETNDYYAAAVLDDEWLNQEQFSYTTHFLHRYAERALGMPDMPINRIIAHIEREITYTVLLYTDGDHKVLASSMGLFLQKYDRTRGINVCKTFISVEMMRTSQIKAFEQVADMIKKYSAEFKRTGDRESIANDFAEECLKNGVFQKDLSDAYGEYFKKRKNHQNRK